MQTEQPQGHRYVFSEIPNNEYGKKLARGIKMFLMTSHTL